MAEWELTTDSHIPYLNITCYILVKAVFDIFTPTVLLNPGQ